MSETETLRNICTIGACKGNGTYRIKVGCTNCDWSSDLVLTKGHEFSRLSESCPTCGCHSLVRKFLP